MKQSLLIAVALTAFVWCSGTRAQDQSISLDTAYGLLPGDTILQSGQVRFVLRLTNNEENSFRGISNGFRIYSPDGATWSEVATDTLSTLDWETNFSFFYMVSVNIDGIGADTVAFAGVGTGIPPAIGLPGFFDDTTYTIAIGPVTTTQPVNSVCLDSSWFPAGGTWLWGDAGDVGSLKPA